MTEATKCAIATVAYNSGVWLKRSRWYFYVTVGLALFFNAVGLQIGLLCLGVGASILSALFAATTCIEWVYEHKATDCKQVSQSAQPPPSTVLEG